MAALTDTLLVLASEASDEAGASKLFVNYFGSSDLTKEWSLDMPEEEEVVAVAAGAGWVAVATDCRMLRIFTRWGG